MTATILTLANINAAKLPTDMRECALAAFRDGSEPTIEYACTHGYNAERTHYAYFPNANRGGVCCGGNTDWTDCNDLEDLIDRWANYDERWVN